MHTVHPRRSRAVFFVLLFSCILLSTACNEDVTVDRDASISIPRGATWAWSANLGTMSESAQKDPALDNDIVRGRISSAIEQTLAAKGFRKVDDPKQADFVVHYHVGIHREQQTVPETGVRQRAVPVIVCDNFGCWQTWRWGYWGPPEIIGYHTVRYREGSLVVDLAQSSSGKLAWRAVGRKEVNRESGSQEEITKSVTRLLRDLKPDK